MKRIIRHELKEHTLKELRDRQAKIDAVVDPAKRAQRTHASWKSKESSRAGKRAFTEIKDVLGRMCNGKRRCMYCEESEASDIEHVRPRSKHPEAAFVWENYLFVCPVCNSRFKGDKYHEGFMDPAAPEYDLWKRWVFDARTGHYLPLHEDDEGAAKTIEILGFDRREVLARQRRDRLEDLVVGIMEYGKAMAKGLPEQAKIHARGLSRYFPALVEWVLICNPSPDHFPAIRVVQKVANSFPEIILDALG